MLEGLQSVSLKQFMNEIAEELGISDYVDTDKAKYPAYYHGAVGGTASKLLNELGQKIVTETPPEQVKSLMEKYDLKVSQEVIDKANSLR